MPWSIGHGRGFATTTRDRACLRLARSLLRDDRRNSRHMTYRHTSPGKISQGGLAKRRDVGLWGNTGWAHGSFALIGYGGQDSVRLRGAHTNRHSDSL